MTIANWSTTASNNTSASPNGILGSRDLPSALPAVIRQNMADTRSWYNDAQWTDLGDAPVYVNGASFTIGSDVTTTYTNSRKIKIFGSTFGTHTGVILTSIFSSPNTTIVVKMDEGTLLTSNISQCFLSAPSAKFNALSSWVSSPQNLIIAGNFSTNPFQRGTSNTGVSSGAYIADRFSWVQSSDAVVNSQQHSSAPTIAQCGVYTLHALEIIVSTASSGSTSTRFGGISYKIEGYDANLINHQLYTIGFWVRATKTGTYCVALRNSGQDRSYIFEYTVNTTLTWEYKTLSLASASSSASGTWDSTNGTGLEIVFTLQAGSTYQTTAGAWQTGNFLATSSQVNGLDSTSNIFEISLFSVVKGLTTFDWSDKMLGDVLARCQRYCFKTYQLGTVPGTAVLNDSIYQVSTGSSATYINFKLPVPMRVTATSTTVYSPSTGVAGKFRNNTTGADADAVLQVIGTQNILYSTSASTTVGHLFSAHGIFTSEL